MLLAFALALTQPDEKWIKLFNERNLDGWKPKITGYSYGDNFGNTFRVKDKAIQVGYEAYGTDFKGRFGHLFYKTPFSNYILKLEYRFTGEQCKGGPGWAYRNSGVMIHGQDPATMSLNQEFPVSAEVQMLGGDLTGVRHTGNLCTPGTNVVRNGKLWTPHCLDSNSETYRMETWVQLEIEVHGYGEVVHRINGQEVMRYEQVQLDPNDNDAKPLIKNGNLKIEGGTISLQSESHPVEFRNIFLKKI